MGQTLPEVFRVVRSADWQKQENQVDESGLAVQLSWALTRVEQERPHCGKALLGLVGMRFLSAAQAVEIRVKHRRASQLLEKRVMARAKARAEIRRGMRARGDPGEFSDRLEDDQRMQSIFETKQ